MNELVFENRPVHVFETPIDEARQLGAMMLFGEKYGDIVRVVEVPGYSVELCGGTHVRSTAEIGPFVLLSESSVGAGVRRVEAVTSGAAWALLDERAARLAALRSEVDAASQGAEGRPQAARSAEVPEPDVRAESGVNVIVQPLDGSTPTSCSSCPTATSRSTRPLRSSSARRRTARCTSSRTSTTSVAEKVSASDVLREAAAIVGGGGGGRPTMARAGGKDPEKLPDALAEAERLIVAAL